MNEGLSDIYWSDIIYSANKRNLKFDLTKEFIWELYLKQNKKCKLSGLDIFLDQDYNKKGLNRHLHTASLDRIDSNGWYSECNVQWVHKLVNNLKGNLQTNELVDFCRKIYLEDLKQRRPDWPEYFIELSYIISTRSKDPSTKCGCVFTDQKYRIISTGYNGGFQNIDDDLIPWNTRPDKYFHIVHSEMNGLLFAKQDLSGCYAFVNGVPCSNCCKHMIQAGIVKIYYGNNLAKMCNKEDQDIVRKLCDLKQVELVHVNI